jgi:hypothetical protein
MFSLYIQIYFFNLISNLNSIDAQIMAKMIGKATASLCAISSPNGISLGGLRAFGF